MTLNSIKKTIKLAYQSLEKQIILLIKNPAVRKRIKTTTQMVRVFTDELIKAVTGFMTADDFKNKISAPIKFIFDTVTKIQVAIVRFIESEKIRHYLNNFRTKTSLLLEQIVKAAKFFFRRQTLGKIVSLATLIGSRQTFDRFIAQTKTYFVIILQSIVEHKRLSAAVAVFLLVILVWPGEPKRPVQTTSITPKRINTTDKPVTINEIVPDFGKFDAGPPRKAAFFDYFSLLIEKRNGSVVKSRQALLTLHQELSDLDNDEKHQVKSMAAYYRINNFDIENDDDWQELLARVNAIPVSLALAQAANESAWGTSRFAREANNFYGQWCFQKGCGLVPARRDKNKTHEVAAFKSPEESVERYIHNLNSHNAYKTLRKIRNRLRTENKLITGIELAEGLLHYSERGKEYIKELQSMIKFNKLTRFD
jgi:Bax protein